MLSFASGIFTAILPCLAYEGDARLRKNSWYTKWIFAIFFNLSSLDIKETAQAVNKTMLELVSSKSDMSQIFKHLDLDSIMEVLRQYLAHSSVDTKVAVLKWIHHLFTEAKDKVTIVITRSDESIYIWILCRCQRTQVDCSQYC